MCFTDRLFISYSLEDQIIFTETYPLGIYFFICIFFTKSSWVSVKNKIKYTGKDSYLQAYVTGIFRWTMVILTFCFSTVYKYWIIFSVSKGKLEILILIMIDDVSEIPRNYFKSKYRSVIQPFCTNSISTSEVMKLSFIYIFSVSWIKVAFCTIALWLKKKKNKRKNINTV